MIDLAIVGFHKAGTSALHQTLRQHPGLISHATGQPPEYVFDSGPEAIRDLVRETRASSGASGDRTKKVLVRDNRLGLDDTGLRSLRIVAPDVHIVVSIREPAERAHSAFLHARRMGFEQRETFDQVLEEYLDRGNDGDCSVPLLEYIRMGMYGRRLHELREIFPAEQIAVVRTQELRDDHQRVIDSLVERADLEKSVVDPIVANQGSEVRSDTLVRAIRSGGRSRQLVRAVLPKRFRRRLLSRMVEANRSKVAQPGLTDSQRDQLQLLYADDALVLARDFKIKFD